MANWIKDAIFYEIYPTSFQDSNSDGIGDLNGITSRLDYIKSVGFNAIWINPFYQSPFKDGGYDVSDFFKVDEKFGTIEDFKNLLNKAHELNIRIIIDLIPGHASEQNPIFLESAKAEKNQYSDLFIWNASVWDLEQPYRLISGRYDRNGCYMVNFFSTQPAFNFGFNKITHPYWQMSFTDERTFATREYIKKILRFWLSLGVDGFRVDMADSLVKNDDEKVATMEVWRYIFKDIKKEFPNAAFVSEWCNPNQSLNCGFDCDFVLDHHDNFCHYLGRSTENTKGKCVLNGGSQVLFKEDLVKRINIAKNTKGLLGIISGNHDCARIATNLDEDKLKLFYMIQFTLPGVPFVYYGDEIGMKHVDLPSKDGGYHRTGDRRPMKWNNAKNLGFSSTDGELYLPQDQNSENVEKCLNDEKSLLHYLIKLIALRKKFKDVSTGNFELLNLGDKIISYKRDDFKVIINLSEDAMEINDLNEVLFSSSDKALLKNKLQPNQGIIYR